LDYNWQRRSKLGGEKVGSGRFYSDNDDDDDDDGDDDDDNNDYDDGILCMLRI